MNSVKIRNKHFFSLRQEIVHLVLEWKKFNSFTRSQATVNNELICNVRLVNIFIIDGERDLKYFLFICITCWWLVADKKVPVTQLFKTCQQLLLSIEIRTTQVIPNINIMDVFSLNPRSLSTTRNITIFHNNSPYWFRQSSI